MTRPDEEEALPRGLRVYLTFILALVATFVLTAPWRLGGRDLNRLSVALGTAALLFAAAMLSPSWRRALARLLRERDVHVSKGGVILAAGIAALFLCRVVFGQWMSLDINAWDTGLFFDGPIFETLAGRPLYCAFVGRSALSRHAFYLLFTFVPFYAVTASAVWLLAAHVAAMTAAVTVSFLVFRRVLRDDLAAAFVAGAFLLNTFTARIAQSGFHLEVFYLPALFLLLYAYAARRPVLFAAAVLLAVSIKEDALLPLGGFAVAAAIFDRRWRPAVLALGASLVTFFVGTRLVIPHFSGDPPGHPWYSNYWFSYGETPVSAAFGMLLHPARLLADIGRSGLPHLLEPLLLLPLLGYQWFLAALPALVVYSVSDNPQLSQFTISYSTPILPFLFAAAAAGLWRVTGWFPAAREPEASRLRRRVGALLLLVVCALDGAGYTLTRPDPARKEVGPALASLNGKPVAVQGSLFVRAGHTAAVRVLDPEREPAGSEAILLAPRTNPYPYSRPDFDALVLRLLADPRYRHIQTEGGLLLFTPAD